MVTLRCGCCSCRRDAAITYNSQPAEKHELNERLVYSVQGWLANLDVKSVVHVLTLTELSFLTSRASVWIPSSGKPFMVSVLLDVAYT